MKVYYKQESFAQTCNQMGAEFIEYEVGKGGYYRMYSQDTCEGQKVLTLSVHEMRGIHDFRNKKHAKNKY